MYIYDDTLLESWKPTRNLIIQSLMWMSKNGWEHAKTTDYGRMWKTGDELR